MDEIYPVLSYLAIKPDVFLQDWRYRMNNGGRAPCTQKDPQSMEKREENIESDQERSCRH